MNEREREFLAYLDGLLAHERSQRAWASGRAGKECERRVDLLERVRQEFLHLAAGQMQMFPATSVQG